MQKEMAEAINKATADHELRMRQLQDRVDAMERSVNEVVSKNKEEEQRMRKVHFCPSLIHFVRKIIMAGTHGK